METAFAFKSHFLKTLIWRGRRLTAEKFVHEILFRLKFVNHGSPFDVFYYSMTSLRPLILLKPVRVNSVVYKVPAPASEHRRRLHAIRFLLTSAKDARGSVTLERIVALFRSVYLSQRNSASDRKFLLYKEALGNRLFIRYLKS